MPLPSRPTLWQLSCLVLAMLARVSAADAVVFYTEPNFQGEALRVEAGARVEDLATLQRANQQSWRGAISSVQIEGAARATVASAPGFRGERLEIAASIPDLYAQPMGGQTWDRAIAAIEVRGPTSAPPAPTYPDRGPGPVVVVPAPPPPPRVVIVEPPRPRIDRRTAERMVEHAFREVLDRPADPTGLRTYRERVMQEGWSQQEVIQQLQRSPEARAIQPEPAIRRMYQEVLGRDADPAGLAHYRAKWREGWTQGQIREDLRRSQEGRGRNIRESITRAYREVLGRDPDPAGMANYERQMREKGLTERDLRRALMNGDEYRQRQRR
ncbi:MAG: hypothetical protein B9S27_07300 [Opitutia bacterium Tous-C8FEB]|nr:MAG: hypothetical protein B9S27_07300 [Opitutae bacterium Tous-C8FEB]